MSPTMCVTVEAAVVQAAAGFLGAKPEWGTLAWRKQPPVTVPLPDPDRLAVLLARPRWHQPTLPLGGGL